MDQARDVRKVRVTQLARCTLAGATSGAILLVIDTALGDGLTAWWAPLDAMGLGMTVGAAVGASLGLLFLLIAPYRKRTRQVSWAALGLVAAALVSSSLGVIAKLGGPHPGLAAVSGLGCLLAGVLCALVAHAFQPTTDQPRGWLGTRSPRERLVVAAILAAAAATVTGATVAIDVLRLYPGAQLAARASVWCAGTLALLAVGDRLPPLSPRNRRLSITAGVAIAAAALLHAAFLPPAALQPWLARPHGSLALSFLRGLTDVDADGYSSLYGGGDCAAFDAAVHPGATEIPANGVDDNCQQGDGELASAAAPGDATAVAIPTSASARSVLLVTIDSLRADHTSVYGYERDTTPQLARFALTATVFERAYTSGGWTSLAVGSMMRGLYPRRLRWSWMFETDRYRLIEPHSPLEPSEHITRVFTAARDDPHPPLAWWLQRRGMHTVAVVDDGPSELLSARLGTGAGFDTLVSVDSLPEQQRDDAGTVSAALAQLASLPLNEPFFMWVHLFGPHGPNTKHPGTPTFGEGNIAEYDHEIAFADQQLGRLLEGVATRDGLPTAVLVAADHGEALSALGRGHGLDLFEGSVRIPLLVRAPGFEPGRSDAVASLVDLFPTVLALTDTPAPQGLDGVDLAHPPDHRIVLTDTWRYDPSGEAAIDLCGASDGRQRLVVDRLQEAAGLFDVHDDNVPPHNLLRARPGGPLEQTLGRYLEQSGGKLDAPPL